MCVVSMISDHFQDKWKPKYPDPVPYTITTNTWPFSQVSKEEFEELKKQVKEMKELLIKAKIYDEKNNEPNCEMEDKIKFLKQVAAFVGIDLDEVFKPKV